MSRRQLALCIFVLFLLGAGWGLSTPLTKIAVSTGYKHFGLLFWQLAIGSVVMTAIAVPLGKHLPRGRDAWLTCLVIALIGSVLPNSASYQAAVHLPAGVVSILLSLIPMFAFPIALGLALDRFQLRRFGGLLCGLFAVLLLVLPGAQMQGTIPVFWVMVAMIAVVFYAFEGNYVAKWGTSGLDPVQVLWGASLIGTVISLPLAVLSGQWITPFQSYGAAEWAQIASSTIHVLVYTGYVWLVRAAGPIFAVQISYLVTLFGVFWAAVLLNESYPVLVWVSLALMILGMVLVQPRRAPAPA